MKNLNFNIIKDLLIIALILICGCSAPVPQKKSSIEEKKPVPKKEKKPIDIDQYSLAFGPKEIKGVISPGFFIADLSGLTYNPNTQSLFAVTNKICTIVELGLDGTVKRTIPANGFHDVEAIAYVGEDIYYVTEEEKGNICKIKINKNTKSIDYNNVPKFNIDGGDFGSKGLEGLCYDSSNKLFFSVKEKTPKVYEIMEPKNDKEEANYKIIWNAYSANLEVTDFSGICYDAKSGNLLVLSQESQCLIEVSIRGKEISRLSLVDKKAGLSKDITEAEGVTLDDKGNLYICSEPNLFFVFRKKR